MNATTKTTPAGARVKRSDLLPVLRLAAMVTERRNTIPILGHVLLTGSGGILTVRATNLDIEYTAHTDGDVSGNFRVSAHARDLARLVAALPGDEITLGQEGDNLTVTAGATSARFWGLCPDDMLHPIDGDMPHQVDMPAEALAAMLGRVEHAISKEITRYYLNGIYLGISDGTLTAVATDGHRLAALSAPAPTGATLPAAGVIYPAAALPVLRAILNRLRDGVAMAFSETRARITTSCGTLVVKTIDGTYPDWQRAIPKWDDMQHRTIKRAALVSALSRVGAVSSRYDRYGLMWTPEDGGVTLSIRKAGESDISEPVQTTGGGTWDQCGTNIHYLRAMLAQFGGDVVMGMNDGRSPLSFRDAADPRAQFVLMPMRV